MSKKTLHIWIDRESYEELLHDYNNITSLIVEAKGYNPLVLDLIRNVGTRIKILDGGHGAKGANGLEGYITSRPSNHGLVPNSHGFNVMCNDGNVWRIAPDAKIVAL